MAEYDPRDAFTVAPPSTQTGGGIGPMKILGIGCAVIFLLSVCPCGGLVVWFVTGPEGGVRLSNEMEDYAVAYLEDHNLLLEDEALVAYYDTTLSLSGEQAAILTNDRLIFHNHAAPDMVIKLSNVTAIRTWNEGIMGDMIEVDSADGRTMKIEIAPLNQGRSFINALQTQVERAGGSLDPQGGPTLPTAPTTPTTSDDPTPPPAP